jgi:hypothetical protein
MLLRDSVSLLSCTAYFYCAIDGTSLCLQCDMDVHSSAGKKLHERYLLMGQRVEVKPPSLWHLQLRYLVRDFLPRKPPVH